jgi:hypothetical protein
VGGEARRYRRLLSVSLAFAPTHLFSHGSISAATLKPHPHPHPGYPPGLPARLDPVQHPPGARLLLPGRRHPPDTSKVQPRRRPGKHHPAPDRDSWAGGAHRHGVDGTVLGTRRGGPHPLAGDRNLPAGARELLFSLFRILPSACRAPVTRQAHDTLFHPRRRANANPRARPMHSAPYPPLPLPARALLRRSCRLYYFLPPPFPRPRPEHATVSFQLLTPASPYAPPHSDPVRAVRVLPALHPFP